MVLQPAVPAVPGDEPPASGMRITRRRGPWLQFGRIRQFEWTSLTLSLPGLAPALHGARMIHVSDMHFSRTWHPAYDQIIVRLRLSPPDLVVLTGDFVDDKYDPQPAWPLVQRFVPQLRSRLGTFAVHGNHDGDFVPPRLAEMGVNVVTGRRALVGCGGGQIELIGLPGTSRMDLDERSVAAMPAKGSGVPRIVLAHYPDLVRQVSTLAPDLYLCGHTHGGQVCLPGRIPIIRHDTLPRRLDSGVHRAFGTWLVVNRGCGFSSHPIRLFCPAEIVEITLERAEVSRPDGREDVDCGPGGP